MNKRPAGSLPPSNERIANAIAQAFGVSREQLAGGSRTRRVAEARMAMLALSRELGGRYATLSDLGRHFGIDHGTVLHACRRVPALCSIDAEFAERVRMAREQALTPCQPR